MQKYLPPDACVLELGGCFGVLACLTNQRLADPSKHVVVEANPQLIEALTHNKDQNACGFEVIHGLVSKNSDGIFHIRPNHVLGSGICRPGKEQVKVPVYSLGDIQNKTGVIFDHFMLDIEGAEYDFIMENKECLRDQARMLLIEFHPNIIGAEKCAAIRQTLEECGFSCAEDLNGVEVWAK